MNKYNKIIIKIFNVTYKIKSLQEIQYSEKLKYGDIIILILFGREKVNFF